MHKEGICHTPFVLIEENAFRSYYWTQHLESFVVKYSHSGSNHQSR